MGVTLSFSVLDAVDDTGSRFRVRSVLGILVRGRTGHLGAGYRSGVTASALVAPVQCSEGLADAEHAVDPFAGGHVRLPILSGAYLGTGLERAVLRGIPAGEIVVATIEYVHGAC